MVVGWFTFCFSMAEGLNTRDILGGISRRFPEAGWTATRSRRFFCLERAESRQGDAVGFGATLGYRIAQSVEQKTCVFLGYSCLGGYCINKTSSVHLCFFVYDAKIAKKNELADG